MVQKELREQCKVQKKAVILEDMDPAKMLEKIWNLVCSDRDEMSTRLIRANTGQTV